MSVQTVAEHNGPYDTPESEAWDEEGAWSLSRLKQAYNDYITGKRDEIEEAYNAKCYRHSAQWTPAQVEIFNKRKQPVVTFNRIGRKIDSIIGLMEKLKQDPKAYPRNPRETDEKGAELATAVVRYVVEAELRENVFPFAIENGAVDGIGCVEMMLIEGDKGDKDIGFALVRSTEFFYDPRSMIHDFSDARFMGQGKWLDVEDAMALTDDKAKKEQIKNSTGAGSELTPSPDQEMRWYSSERSYKRVRVVDLWYKCEGGWKWCLFTGSLKIAEGDSYFFDEKGNQISKYRAFSSYVDHDGDRYGFVRALRSSQDEINQRRSKGLHELVSRRIKAEDGAFSDVNEARREAVRPDGVVIYNKGFEMEFDDAVRVSNIEGQLKFLEDAKNEIENFGPNPALIGQGLEYKSGRAINLLQQAGIAELGPFVINVRNWKLGLYRAIWNAVQRYWTAERWIRVTDDENIAQAIQVNGMELDEYGVPRLVNYLGALDVNFTLDEGPDEVNMMGDAYDTLVALTAQGANIPPQVLLELAPLQGSLKRKLLAMIGKPDPIADQAKQLTIADASAKVDETKSKTALNMAKVQETANGGAHGIAERQMDMQARQQEMQIKGAEGAMKIQQGREKLSLEREKGRMKLQGDFAKLESERVKGQQDLLVQRALGSQKLETQRQAGLLKMRQQASQKVGRNVKGYADGGRPDVGFPALVGEEGPEIFVPDRAGTIVPLGRGRFAEELKDPRVRDRLISYTNAEVGSQGPDARKAFMETIFNRAVARNKPLAEVLSGSYFPSVTHQRASRPVDERTRGAYAPTIDEVLGGSNISSYATGNASGSVGFNGGPQTFAAGGERYGIEGPDKNWWQRVGAEGPGQAPGAVGYTQRPEAHSLADLQPLRSPSTAAVDPLRSTGSLFGGPFIDYVAQRDRR